MPPRAPSPRARRSPAAAGAGERLRQAGRRVDLQRRADARQPPERCDERGASPRPSGQLLAEEHDLRPQRPAALAALGRAPRSRHSARARAPCPPRRRSAGSARVRRWPCTSTASLPAAWCRPSMFCVTTPERKPPASSRASAACAGLWRMLVPTSGSAQHCQTRAGSRESMSTWPSTMGIEALPEAARRAEVGQAAGGRDARAGEREHGRVALEERASATASGSGRHHASTVAPA